MLSGFIANVLMVVAILKNKSLRTPMNMDLVSLACSIVGAVCVMNPTNKLAGRRKVEMRAVKRIAVLTGSFAVLWLPLPMASMLFSNSASMSENDLVVLLLMGAVSSLTVAVNPLLNLLLNKQLRSATITLFKRIVNKLKSNL
ncbi:5-hydroxytryptamine receptor 2B-like [Dreissena polymorpha]|uniref:5-hydroxytryptamine receptor 2B-like n=1 Tax=Dreissena polymorpha TaxID=45954 RepID=UPI0022653096|nr:5-hydroxytryptamine receptor 2B-like [Dreissena polymorpha]